MRAALAFLTPLPAGARVPGPRTLDWFPVAGALLGLAVGGIWLGLDAMFPPLVVAALVVATDLALTGALHVDGLADTADGVLPHLERDRRLAVMAEPDVGAFGIVAVLATLLLRFTAFASVAPDALLLGGLWCASRTAMAVVARSLRYARQGGGLASALLGRPAWPVALGGLALALALACQGAGPVGAAGVIAVAGGAAAVVVLAHRRLGGFTGDVLGAAGLVGETLGLIVATARW